MSEIKVNKLSPRSGTAVTLGDSGDTFTIPSGATLAIAGSVTGFTSAGIDDNATSVAITIDSSEQVGIGTTSPTRQLTVSGSVSPVIAIIDTGTSGTPSLFFGDSSADNIGKIQYYNSDNSLATVVNGSERMRIDSSGNIGIGTSSPTHNLTVDGGTSTSVSLIKDATGSATVRYYDGGSQKAYIQLTTSEDMDFFAASGTDQIFYGQGVERMRLNGGAVFNEGSVDADFRVESNGNANMLYVDGGNNKVGIGTSIPDSVLNIVTNSGSNGDRIRIQDSTYKLDLGVGATSFIQTVGASALKINTNATERMRILSSGNIGIGTSTPDAVLQVGALGQSGSVRGAVAIKTIANYTTFGESAIYIEEASGSEGYYMGVDVSGGMFFNNSGAAGSTLYLGDDDNVGIGTTAPQNTLHVLKSAISGASYRTNAPLIIENNSNTEIQILSANSSDGQLRFGDADANFRGAITYSHSDDSFTIATNGASQVKIHSNGVMSAADGIALGVGTANTASNVLSDYEEGTWTPVFAYGTSGSGYARQAGRYTKIGNKVFFELDIEGNGLSSTTDQMVIGGLPFLSNSSAPYGGGVMNYTNGIYTSEQLLFHIGGNDQRMYLYQLTGSSFLGSEAVNVNKRMLIHGQYTTA